MDENERRDLALFRYGIIACLISNMNLGMSKASKIRELSEATYVMPGTEEPIRFKPSTIKKWYQDYTKGGYHALIPKQRIDLGTSRALSEEQQKRIIEIRTAFPKMSAESVRKQMITEGILREVDCSVDTIQRFINAKHLSAEKTQEDECLAFEFEHVNDCWQGDTMEGPKVKRGKEEVKTYCITFLDDHSRLPMASIHYFNDNSVNVQATLKEAVRRYGIPKMLVLDNGSPYRDKQFMEVCAELGIHAVHLRPYDPAGKGKIERAQGVFQGQFYNTHNFDGYSLEMLNDAFHEYLFQDYNHHHHRMTQETPLSRYMREYHLIRRIDKEHLDFVFLHRDKRKLSKDSCISVNKTRYEVPQEYIRTLTDRTVWFRYHPDDYSELYLVDEMNYKILYTLKPVDLHANSNRKRNRESAVNYKSAI